MEKNQHKPESNPERGERNGATGRQPGQQLPSGEESANLDTDSTPDEPAQHSESSFPRQDNETLGTP